MGKRVDEKKEQLPVIVKESTVNEAYEEFVRLNEDPLVTIKQKELAERAKLQTNPFKIRKMRDDLLEKVITDPKEREEVAQLLAAKEKRRMEKKQQKRIKKDQKRREKIER